MIGRSSVPERRRLHIPLNLRWAWNDRLERVRRVDAPLDLRREPVRPHDLVFAKRPRQSWANCGRSRQIQCKYTHTYIYVMLLSHSHHWPATGCHDRHIAIDA